MKNTTEADSPSTTAGNCNNEPTLPPDLSSLTAARAAELIMEGKITSEALVKSCLHRIEKHAHLNTFITVDADRALAEARAWDRRIAAGEKGAPLGGVPIAVKDNIHVAGMPNTAGTPSLKNFVPDMDAPVVHSLKQAGAIVIGKTNMHELAWGATGYNLAYHGTDYIGVRNAHSVERIAGGSSSGSGSAVAAHLVPAALGTDTGASIRQPAALNGCVGFRPTQDRYSHDGMTPISSSRDTAGPLANSVEDIILLDKVITGKEYAVHIQPEQIRLGIHSYFWRELDQEVQEIAAYALEKIRLAGIKIVPVDMSGLEQAVNEIMFTAALYEGKHALAHYLERYKTNVSMDELVSNIASPDVRNYFDDLVMPGLAPDSEGRLVPVEPLYKKALQSGVPALEALYTSAFATANVDALIFPTVPAIAPYASETVSDAAQFASLIRNTSPGSLIRLPGLSIPAGKGTQSKMPVGMEIDGLPGKDELILAIGLLIESALCG